MNTITKGKIAPQKETYQIGDIFSLDSGFSFYILSQVGEYKVNLINLRDGNRYTNEILVKNILNITKEEVKKLFCGDKFLRINYSITITPE